VSVSAPRSPLSIPALRDAVKGRVITPDDTDYDEARTVKMGGVDKRPAAIVRVANPGDVAEVIKVARETGLELAVRCGGHSGAAHSTTDDGLVIDLRELKAIDVDPEEGSAWAGGGVTAAEYTAATAKHGMATGFGDTGTVGLGGITTGGGVGYLGRKHGLTIDSLLAAEVVTADGEVRYVDAETEPDLFWAIRGGGGNFGVVTRFKYRLHPARDLLGGMLFLPATPETVEGFIAAAEAAPDELSTIANIMPLPPMPFLPEDTVGKVAIMGMMVWSGDLDAGQRAFEPFRKLAPPLGDLIKPMDSMGDMYGPEDDSYRPLAVARTMHIDRVDRAVATTILDFLEKSDAALRAAQLRVLGGAIARVPADATAYAHRKSRIMVNLAAFYESEADKADKQRWVDDFARALDQGDPALYVNFVGDEGEAAVHAAYPGKTWDRLAAIKGRYDPENLFRLNQNVPPAGEGASA
jgi:FAD/FMN-containing dehydrogenase